MGEVLAEEGKQDDPVLDDRMEIGFFIYAASGVRHPAMTRDDAMIHSIIQSQKQGDGTHG